MKNPIAEVATTASGKFLLALWSLILVMIVLLIFADYFPSNIFGKTAVVAILILFNTSIIVTHLVKKGTDTIAKVVWTVLCVVVVTVLLTIPDSHHPDARRDTGIFLIYSMFALTFPSGFLVPLVTYLFDMFDKPDWFDFGIVNLYVSNLIAWVSFFVVGYLQWFKLAPYLIAKLCTLRKRKRVQ